MGHIDFAGALRQARATDPGAIPEILVSASADIGATDLVVYLVDFGRTVLEPLPGRSAHAELPTTEEVGASMAGRAFIEEAVVSAERAEGIRAWAPILEGSDCTGVVAVTLPGTDHGELEACEELGLLAGNLIAAHARCTDLYNLHRRRRAMTLAASLQWDLLPPLVIRTGLLTVAGHVEPAYEVGGDCFDYAANGPEFDVAIMDAMGHGLTSSRVAGLAMGTYRHGRREAASLLALHDALGTTITEQHPDHSFVTGILARIDVATGALSWTNAGHPLPLLVRGGRVVAELACPPTPPWGLLPGTPTLATEALEPGDCVLLYTDGVVESRTPDGEVFGIERLIDLTQAQASNLLEPTEVVRQLVRSVLDHQRTELRDDATIVLVRWEGPSPA